MCNSLFLVNAFFNSARSASVCNLMTLRQQPICLAINMGKIFAKNGACKIFSKRMHAKYLQNRVHAKYFQKGFVQNIYKKGEIFAKKGARKILAKRVRAKPVQF